MATLQEGFVKCVTGLSIPARCLLSVSSRLKLLCLLLYMPVPSLQVQPVETDQPGPAWNLPFTFRLS